LCALAFALGLLAPRASAQFMAQVAEESDQTNQPGGFQLKKEDRKIIDALTDFERYRDKKAWDLAFRSINTLTETPSKGMIQAKDGFWFPSNVRIFKSLISLPPEGREAYRAFNDPKAKQLFEQAKSPDAADEIPSLRKIYEQYFVTSVGPQAADRLGDAYFETGDFLAAESVWASIMANAPDADLSPAKLCVKRAVALSRSGQIVRLRDLSQTVREKYATEKVIVGGNEVAVADYIDSLISSSTTKPVDETVAQADFRLPEKDEPAWQMEFAGEDILNALRNSLNNMGWGQWMSNLTNFVPPATVDENRVYVNFLGIVFALDAKSGKLLWRTDKFTDIVGKAQEFANYGLDTDRYMLVPANDFVLAVRVPIKRVNYQEPFRLSCLVAETGKQKWSSESGSLSSWSFAGAPLVSGNSVLAVAAPQNSRDLSLLSIKLDTGRLEWSMPLGTMQVGNSYRGEPQIPTPTLAQRGEMLYVLTNNFALLAVNMPAKRVEWAFTFGAPPMVGNQNYYWGEQYAKPIESPATAVLRGGDLYIKETNGDGVYDIDLSGPSLRWRRPAAGSDQIAAITPTRMLLLGEEASAIDMAGERPMLWSLSLPALTGQMRPLTAGDNFYAFVSRGIFQIDAKTGDTKRIFRGADRDALGGQLYVMRDKLIAVSNLKVTAYPLQTTSATAAK
jgi:outer membrane protein assembly factor BamB